MILRNMRYMKLKGKIDMAEFIIAANNENDVNFFRKNKCMEVIRCGECKFGYEQKLRLTGEMVIRCLKRNFDIDPQWFCADGKKE